MDIGNSCAIRNGYEKANGYVNKVRKIFTHFKNTVHKAARSQLKVGDERHLLFKEVQEVQASLEKVPDHFKLPLRRCEKIKLPSGRCWITVELWTFRSHFATGDKTNLLIISLDIHLMYRAHGHGTTEDVQAMEHDARKGPDKMIGNSLGPYSLQVESIMRMYCHLSLPGIGHSTTRSEQVRMHPRRTAGFLPIEPKKPRAKLKAVRLLNRSHWGCNAAWVETKTQHTRKPSNGTQPMSKTNCVLKFGSEARSGTANRILGTQKCNVSVGQKPRMKKRVCIHPPLDRYIHIRGDGWDIYPPPNTNADVPLRVPPGPNTCLAHPTAPPSSQSLTEEEKRGKGGNEGKRRGKGMTEPRPGRRK
ncbi:hypothetical protein B0H17DRAFT_1150680 [Mycena rosella]|uniref:Uncharacterized protein n=1 Tax=Mycena rosella TaxID=1033263 RepID=A0AAD7BSJ4_MYCRO|nr:hypothetical protein B0H17DRAFT_1150680 [Mycena rosella]